jgi:hypothetical protein
MSQHIYNICIFRRKIAIISTPTNMAKMTSVPRIYGCVAALNALFLGLDVNAFSPISPSNRANIISSNHYEVRSFSSWSSTSTNLRAEPFFAEEKEGTVVKSSQNDDEEIGSMAGDTSNSVESMSGTVYDNLGFEEDKIALGIDADLVSVLYIM